MCLGLGVGEAKAWQNADALLPVCAARLRPHGAARTRSRRLQAVQLHKHKHMRMRPGCCRGGKASGSIAQRGESRSALKAQLAPRAFESHPAQTALTGACKLPSCPPSLIQHLRAPIYPRCCRRTQRARGFACGGLIRYICELMMMRNRLYQIYGTWASCTLRYATLPRRSHAPGTRCRCCSTGADKT